jgi:hypothetical protein
MINDILKNLFEKWNTEQKCGKCWVYVPTFNDAIKGNTNLYKPTKETICCTHVFLEGLSIKTNKEINNFTGMATVTYCDYSLHFKIVEKSDFQMQKGSELKCGDSIFEKHVAPLIDCLSCNFEDDVCALFEGGTGIVFNEETKPYFSFGDENWAGLDYRLTLREYKG